MASGARYVPNRREFARFMKSNDVGRATEAAAERGKSHAESIAPVLTGEYKRSFRVETQVVGDRQQSLLVNDAAHAAFVELDDRVLGRTVDHIERSL